MSRMSELFYDQGIDKMTDQEFDKWKYNFYKVEDKLTQLVTDWLADIYHEEFESLSSQFSDDPEHEKFHGKTTACQQKGNNAKLHYCTRND